MLKNYRSESKNTFDKIQKILASHKARQVFFDYEDNGRVKTLGFSLEIKGKFVGFRLPARVEKVELLISNKDQAYRTAWANIRDWLDAQMALIDTEQVKMEEVFLPYAIGRDGKTFFEMVENNNFLLGDGK